MDSSIHRAHVESVKVLDKDGAACVDNAGAEIWDPAKGDWLCRENIPTTRGTNQGAFPVEQDLKNNGPYYPRKQSQDAVAETAAADATAVPMAAKTQPASHPRGLCTRGHD